MKGLTVFFNGHLDGKLHFVYILQTADRRLYTGYTTDLARRLKQHQSGAGAKFTRAFGAKKMLYSETFSSKSEALKREAAIKNLTRSKKEDLIVQKRCAWATSDPLYVAYHDHEWGVPVYDDRKHFEFLVLESAQAGLSWLTVLKKRQNYKKAFSQFNPQKVAQFGRAEVNALLQNSGIIRNRLKIEAAINNARRFLEVQKEFGSFTDYCWQFVGGKPIQNRWKNIKQLPAKTEVSDAWSLDLKKRGFKFIGSTIIYAHMQAVGMVNDHTTDCFRHPECAQK